VASFGSGRGNVLYLIVCAAPPASHIVDSIAGLQEAGWEVCPVTTPAAAAWTDTQGLQAATGHPVRSVFRAPDEPEFQPRGDAVLVAPATFNTINSSAAGINDTLALGLINEALGNRSVPIAVVPWVNTALADHPAYRPSLARLQAAGAQIIEGEMGEMMAFDRACRAAASLLSAAAAGMATDAI
jgi:phosphopantothenoylcysteine synthetase/decarboxylase